jgi:hypothetical protein
MAANILQVNYLPCPLYGLRQFFPRLCVPCFVLAWTHGLLTCRSMRAGCACALAFAIERLQILQGLYPGRDLGIGARNKIV